MSDKHPTDKMICTQFTNEEINRLLQRAETAERELSELRDRLLIQIATLESDKGAVERMYRQKSELLDTEIAQHYACQEREKRLAAAFMGHYWDTLEPHRELILLHVVAVLKGADHATPT